MRRPGRWVSPWTGFFIEAFRSLLEECIATARDKTAQRWAPEGLTALRTSREEFPIEVTLSPFEVGRERYYTLILRDVKERNRIEADLQRLRLERSYLTEELRSGYRLEEIVGESPLMKRLLAQVEQVAGADSTVLLLGETGTGKELVTHALHGLSRRGKSSW